MTLSSLPAHVVGRKTLISHGSTDRGQANPATVELVDGFTRDVSKIGHYGTGDLEIRITDNAQLAQAEPLLAMSYANS